MLKFKVLTPGCEPQRMRIEDAGIDLCAGQDMVVTPGYSVVMPLGVAVKIEDGQYGMLTHRSSLAFKKEMTASLGIIDSNFTQEMKAKIFNHGRLSQVIKKGDRICQLVLHNFAREEMEEVEDLGIGKGGFGSSGV